MDNSRQPSTITQKWKRQSEPECGMKSKIITWSLISLMAFLTACGGGDDTAAQATTNPDSKETVEEEDTTPDPVADVPDDAIGLGHGVDAAYKDQLAATGLSAGESLSASGSTTVTVNVVNLDNNNSEYLGLTNIYFLSTCTQVGLAEFTPDTLQASGVATATYQDKGCGKEFGATDNIVVYIGEKDEDGNIVAEATARTTIDVAPAQVGAIQYIGSSASIIALNGYGTDDHPSLSSIEFQVVDKSGNSMPDRTVQFSLDHKIGTASLSLDEAVSDQEGKVRVILNSGNAPGSVRIKALVDVVDSNGSLVKSITTSSPAVAMATSLADYDSFTISADLFNPAAWDWSGNVVNITARLGDHFQNPVIDGTSVYFRATGGAIEESCETTNGACSVKWTGQNPRPVDGLVTITAQTRGQGGFQDSNANGIFDLGESFTSHAESYVDANGNGVFDEGEAYQPDLDVDEDGTNEFSWSDQAYQVNVDPDGAVGSGGYVVGDSNFYEEFIDTNKNGVLDGDSGLKFQGDNCSADAVAAGHCAEQIDMVKSMRLQMSASTNAYVEGPFLWSDSLGRYDTSNTLTCVDASSTGGAKNIAWRVSDSKSRRNNLPSGSKTSLDTTDVKVLSNTSGLIDSYYPVVSLPVWKASNDSLDVPLVGDDKRYAYLAARGHLVTANIVRLDDIDTDFVSPTGLGSVVLKVDTVNGPDINSDLLEVDFIGSESKLIADLQGVVGSLDVTSGAQDFTLTIQNRCGYGLETGSLVITSDNGIISNASAAGNALNAAIAPPVGGITVISADIDSTSNAATVLRFTLTPDVSSNDDGSLSVTLKVPVPGYSYSDYTDINSYIIKD